MKKEFKEIYIYCFVTDSFGTLNYQENEYSTHSEPHRPALRATRSIM